MRARTLKRVARIFYVAGWIMIVAAIIEFGWAWVLGGFVFMFGGLITMALPDTDPDGEE